MSIYTMALLAVTISLAGCHKENDLKREVSRSNQLSEKNLDATSITTPSPKDDETVSVPVSITGSYLACIKIAEDPALYQQKIGCRMETPSGPMEGFKGRVDKLAWTQRGEGSAVKIQLLTDGVDSNWLAVFDIRADASAIQSLVEFSLSFTLDGVDGHLKSDLTLLWNKDCALPAIQFESLGDSNGLGAVVANQFAESHGIRFSTLSGNPVVLAGYNQASPVGYYGGPNNIANYLAPNQSGGKFFLTDRHKQAEVTDTLVVDYEQPVKEASIDLVDIDFSETYVVRALNSLGQVVDEVRYQSISGGTRDGQLSRFIVRTPDGSRGISKLNIFGFNPPGGVGIGFGIDNFSPRCAR